MINKVINRLYMYLSRYIDNQSKIGKNTFIGKNVTITKATIGNYCSIAPHVSIGPGEHDLSRISTASLVYDDPYSELTEKPVTIGNDVWIGTHVVILRGVSIGNGAVVGAGSVVTKDIPAFAVVAGVPAKIIKYRFNKEQIGLIEKSKWWEKSPKEAKKSIGILTSQIKKYT